MSFSNDNLPGNFKLAGNVSYTSSGTRLSNHVQNTSKQLNLTLVSFTQAQNGISVKPQGPVLYLDVNPKSFAINMSKSVDAGSYSRAGYIPQFWGDELDVISVQGTSAAFIHSTKGLTRQEASDTVGYKNFMTLLALYKNNGSVFKKNGTQTTDQNFTNNETGQQRKTLSSIKNAFKSNPTDQNALVSSSSRRVIDYRNLIRLNYAELDAFGTFDSFSWSDSEDKPFNFDYSFEFTVLFYNNLTTEVNGHIKKT